MTPREVANHLLGEHPLGVSDYARVWLFNAIEAAIQSERDHADRRVAEAEANAERREYAVKYYTGEDVDLLVERLDAEEAS